jgi:Fur family transcriptional regulator, ferric uptake regulator
MTHQQLDYATLMRQQGYRVTPQRQLILDAVCDGNGHTTAEEIYARVRATAPTVNRATVYRTLDFLCDLGLVVGADVGTGPMVYEIAGETPHHHLVCQQCGQVEQIDHELVQPFFEKIEQERQFTVKTNHLALFGSCRRCRPK